MKKYQSLAQQIISQIELGVWLPGDKLPSLREQVASSGMSFMTVGHAYQMLESQGRIVARPQSGYYVASRPTAHQPAPPAQVMRIPTSSTSYRPAATRPLFLLPPRFPIPDFSRCSSSTARWRTSAKPRRR